MSVAANMLMMTSMLRPRKEKEQTSGGNVVFETMFIFRNEEKSLEVMFSEYDKETLKDIQIGERKILHNGIEFKLHRIMTYMNGDSVSSRKVVDN